MSIVFLGAWKDFLDDLYRIFIFWSYPQSNLIGFENEEDGTRMTT